MLQIARPDRRVNQKRPPKEVHRKSGPWKNRKAKGDQATTQRAPENDKDNESTRIAVNTIAGGFAGGGESSSARKRYLRWTERETHSANNVTFPPTPDLSFSPKDTRGMVPHDDDPLVIQVQIQNCDVKRVMIDS
jgi:hypothetical protein